MVVSQMAKRPIESGLECPSCGYNLKSLTSSRCPECGNTFVVSASKDPTKKPLMRSLGEFVGHIVKGLRTDPAKKVLRKEVREQKCDDGVILRRTTIEEVELRAKDRDQ
jgi:predicted amidophosphoribosyltransferase